MVLLGERPVALVAWSWLTVVLLGLAGCHSMRGLVAAHTLPVSLLGFFSPGL